MVKRQESSNAKFRLVCELITLREAVWRNAQFIQSIPVRIDECLGPLIKTTPDSVVGIQGATDLLERISCLIGDPSYCWREFDKTTAPVIPSSLATQDAESVLTMSSDGHIVDWSESFGIPVNDWLATHFPVEKQTCPSNKTHKIPTTFGELRAQGVFILEEDLGERIILKTDSEPHAGIFKGSQKVYRRSDCYELKSESQFRVLCRSVLVGAHPRRIRRGGIKFYSIDQTQYTTQLEWVLPKISGVTEVNAYSAFIETVFKIDSPILWAPATINGKRGIVVYALHHNTAMSDIARGFSSAQQTETVPATALKFFSKLFKRVLIDKLVEDKFIQKT
jgi:hypothetical protein